VEELAEGRVDSVGNLLRRPTRLHKKIPVFTREERSRRVGGQHF
jgi:hypothetical protein